MSPGKKHLGDGVMPAAVTTGKNHGKEFIGKFRVLPDPVFDGATEVVNSVPHHLVTGFGFIHPSFVFLVPIHDDAAGVIRLTHVLYDVKACAQEKHGPGNVR